MTDVLIALPDQDERMAFRITLDHLGMNVVGEADTWTATVTSATAIRPDLVLVDWALLAREHGLLGHLRSVCPPSTMIVLISSLNARQQAARSANADCFISRSETPDRIARYLQDITGHALSR